MCLRLKNEACAASALLMLRSVHNDASSPWFSICISMHVQVIIGLKLASCRWECCLLIAKLLCQAMHLGFQYVDAKRPFVGNNLTSPRFLLKSTVGLHSPVLENSIHVHKLTVIAGFWCQAKAWAVLVDRWLSDRWCDGGRLSGQTTEVQSFVEQQRKSRFCWINKLEIYSNSVTLTEISPCSYPRFNQAEQSN